MSLSSCKTTHLFSSKLLRAALAFSRMHCLCAMSMLLSVILRGWFLKHKTKTIGKKSFAVFCALTNLRTVTIFMYEFIRCFPPLLRSKLLSTLYFKPPSRKNHGHGLKLHQLFPYICRTGCFFSFCLQLWKV